MRSTVKQVAWKDAEATYLLMKLEDQGRQDVKDEALRRISDFRSMLAIEVRILARHSRPRES